MGLLLIDLEAVRDDLGCVVGAVFGERPTVQPREELVARLNGRATAEHRADDTPEIIANRLEVYEEQTRPVIEYYEDRGLVKRVSGVGSVKEITARLREAAE